MATPSMARRLYRAIPLPLRNLSVVKTVTLFLESHVLPHNWVYDAAFYEESVDGPARRSAQSIVTTVIRDLKPKRVADVGCGTGAMLELMRDCGCDVLGFEKSQAALELCRSHGVPVRELDLERDDTPDVGRFDIVISMEVAEHLPQKVDERYVQLLTQLGDVVVFTAAPPGQGGTDHINEQPAEYWEAKFVSRGFRLNNEITGRWQKEWRESGLVTPWYYANLMVFESGQPSN